MGITETIAIRRLQFEREQQEAQRQKGAEEAELRQWRKSRLEGCNSFLERVQIRQVLDEVNRELLHNKGHVGVKPAYFETRVGEVEGFDGTEYTLSEYAKASCSLIWKKHRKEHSISAEVKVRVGKGNDRLYFSLDLGHSDCESRNHDLSLSCFEDEDPKTADMLLNGGRATYVNDPVSDAKELVYLSIAEYCEELQRHKIL